MKILIMYPHGLGDCILLTPALKALKETTGAFIGVATLERFKSAELFSANPNVDQTLYTKDAWNDYPSYEVGIRAVQMQCDNMATELKYDKLVFIQHSANGSKIKDCFGILRLKPDEHDCHTHIYTTAYEEKIAENIVHKSKVGSEFGFVHGVTGVESKDFPEGYGFCWIYGKTGLHSLEPGCDWNQFNVSIGIGFEIMRMASKVAVADSVYYHAAGAMDKRIDLAYFQKGESVYNRVRPLHDVEQNIVYELEDL